MMIWSAKSGTASHDYDDFDNEYDDFDNDYDDDGDDDDDLIRQERLPVIGAEIKAILRSATSFSLPIHLHHDDDDDDDDDDDEYDADDDVNKCNWRIMTNTIVNNDKYNCNGWRDLHLFIGATIYLFSPSLCQSNICY